MHSSVRWIAATLLLGVAVPARAQLNASVVGTGFTQPVFGTSPANDPLLYVVQKGGVIQTLNPQNGAKADFLNISAEVRTEGERGLLGMAFHPDYANGNGRFYLQYTVTGATSASAARVEEFTTTNGAVTGRRTILQFDTPKFNNADNHNAGWIGFNPRPEAGGRTDLYIATGDSGSGNDPLNFAQNRDSLQGKMLRIDVNGTTVGGRYSIPAGNNGTAAAPEVYAYGLRNPYRNSFDRATGGLYIADVGQNSQEELNSVTPGTPGGKNYGWRVREGTIKTPGVNDPDILPQDRVDPVFVYEHSSGFGRSITGGYVYRGTAVDDSGVAMNGKYVFADYVSGRVYSLFIDQSGTEFIDRTAEFGLTARAFSITSFAEDGLGNLYMIDINGTVYRMIPVPEPAGVGLVAAIGAAVAFRRRTLRRRSGPPLPSTA